MARPHIRHQNGGQSQTITDKNAGGRLDGSAPDDAATATPGTAPEAPQTGAADLAGIIAGLRAELAAQRRENAELRQTLATLTAAIAALNKKDD